jgi:peptidase E
VTSRASTQKNQLEEAVKHIEKARKVFIALGLPLSRISTMDDALKAITNILERKFDNA